MKINTAKKTLALLMTTILVAGMVTGCGSSANSPASTPAASGESQVSSVASEGSKDPVTLTVWGDTDNQAILEETFGELNAAFAAKHPNIKIDYQWSGSFDGIKVAMQSDSLPDMFWVQGNKSSQMAEMAEAGFLLPLDQFGPDPTGYPQGSIDYAMVDGKTYCSYPGFIDYSLIYYNADLFKEHNIERPKTYDDFVKAMETLSSAGVTPFSLGGDFEWSRYWPIQTLGATFANNDLKSIEDGKITGEFPEIEFVFDQFAEFCQKGYFGTPAGAMDESSAQLAFANGKVAMICEGTWNNNLLSDVDFEVGRFAMPNKEGVRYAQSGYTNYLTYAISSKCENPAEAWEYINFLNSVEANQICQDRMNSIPVLKGVEVKDPVVEQISDFQEVGYNIYHVLSAVPTKSGKPQDVFISNVVSDLMTGKITGKEGVQRIVDEMNK